jgi:hypothetical protein
MTFDKGIDTGVDTGILGATKISWEHDSARNLLLQIIEEYPDGNNQIWAQHLRERAPAEDCDWPIYLYFVTNHARALMRGPKRKRKRGKTGGAVAKAKVRARLLDLLMPNGMALRDCTGQQVENFGKADEQRGRWLQRVAAEVGPDKRVGEVLGEKQLKALLRTGEAR